MTFMTGCPNPSTRRTTSRYLDGNSFIITPPFSPSAIWTTSGGTLRRRAPAPEPLRLVIRLHLGDQLGVAALGLDDAR